MDELLLCFRAVFPTTIPVWERVLFGVIMLAITVISLLLNLILAAVIFRKNLVDESVQPHMVSLIVASVIYLLPNCWLLLPTILGSTKSVDPYNLILSTPNTIGYFMIMFTTATMAVDRFVTFFLPSVHKLLTHSEIVRYFLTTFPCILSLIITLHMNVLGCHKRVNPYTLSFTYGCSDCTIYGPLLPIFAFSFSGLNFVVYSAIFLLILKMRTRVSLVNTPLIKQREVKLVVHFSLICMAQFIGSSCFYFLPAVTCGHHVSFYLTAIFSTLNTMTNPCVMFLFHLKIRQEVRRIFTIARHSTATVATTATRCRIRKSSWFGLM
ncbi:hypothetical protein Aduo_004714 [Ancylostoma duodenale]